MPQKIPVRLQGSHMAATPAAGRPLTLTINQVPLAPPSAGWEVLYLYDGLKPFLFLELSHPHHGRASWVFNEAGERLSVSVPSLPAAAQQQLASLPCLGQQPAVISLIQEPDPTNPPDPLDALSPAAKQALAALHQGGALLPARQVPASNLQNITLPNGAAIAAAAFQAACAQNLQARYLAACQTGSFSWPSPADGALVEEARGLVLSPLLMAWRCVDRRHHFVFYVLAAGFDQQTYGIWLPAAGILALSPPPATLPAPPPTEPVIALLTAHISQNLPLLQPFLRQPIARFAHFTWPDAHRTLKHSLWHELPGLEKLVDHLAPEHYPLIIAMGAATDAQFLGRLRDLFPELRGHQVGQIRDFAQLTQWAYPLGVQPLRFSGHSVSAAIRDRLANIMAADPAAEPARQAAAREPGPIAAFGLRVENRTLCDLPGFFVPLAQALAQQFGSVTILLASDHDGTSDAAQATRETVATLQAQLANSAVTLIDCAGMNPVESLVWLNLCDAFVSPWGAGLAKFRWALNKPGYVLVSQAYRGLQADLPIYHQPDYMEAPREQIIVPASLVTDRPDAPVLIESHPGLPLIGTNFDIDVPAVTAAARELITRAFHDIEARRRNRPTPYEALNIQSGVITGLGEELFLATGGHEILDHISGQRRPVPSSYRNFSANIAGRRKLAGSIGAAYTHIIFPDKQSVLGHRLAVKEVICLGELYRARCAEIWDDVVYPRAELRSSTGPTFQRTDTHLTPHGTLTVLLNVMRQVVDTETLAKLEALAPHITIQRERTGDLGRMLGGTVSETVHYLPADRSWSTLSNASMQEGNTGLVNLVFAPKAPDRRRVLMFGDSFMSDFTAFLAYVFAEVAFCRSAYVHDDMVQSMRPDILISGNVERYLSHVQPDSSRPNFFLMGGLGRGTPEQRSFTDGFAAALSPGTSRHRKFMDGLLYKAG